MAKGKVERDDCMHGHCCGGKITGGLVLLATGLAIENGWTFGQILILVGGIFIVKGLLMRSAARR